MKRIFVLWIVLSVFSSCSTNSLFETEIVAQINMSPTSYYSHATPKFEWVKNQEVMKTTYGSRYPDSEGHIYSSINVPSGQVSEYSVRLSAANAYGYTVQDEKSFSSYRLTNEFNQY